MLFESLFDVPVGVSNSVNCYSQEYCFERK